MVLPDHYIEHEALIDQMIEAGLTSSHVAASVLNILGRTRDALQMMST